MSRNLKSERGAATIEALGVMSVLILALILALVGGITFYNLNTLNAASQNLALTTQAGVDRYCSPNQTSAQAVNCQGAQGLDNGSAAGQAFIDSRDSIIASTQASMPYVDPGGLTAIYDIKPPATAANTGWPVAYGPDGVPQAAPSFEGIPGWGFSSVKLSATQGLVGGSSLIPALSTPLSLKAQSIAISFQQP